MRGQTGHKHDRTPNYHGYKSMDDLTTERSFVLQVTWVLGVLGLIFDMLSKCVCTIRH